MNRSGKALTIVLLVLAILFFSLTAITAFFYYEENEMRKATEAELEQVKTLNTTLEDTLKKSRKKVFLLEEKNREADERINALMDDLDLEKGLRDQLKIENAALQEIIDSKSKDGESLQKEIISLQDEASAVEMKLKESEEMRNELQKKLDSILKLDEPSEEKEELSAIEYEKIVVAPGDIRGGRVLRVDQDDNFLIFDLGRQDGIQKGMTMSLNRSEKYLGDIVVTRVQQNMAVGDFIPPLTGRKVRKNDKVIAKQ